MLCNFNMVTGEVTLDAPPCAGTLVVVMRDVTSPTSDHIFLDELPLETFIPWDVLEVEHKLKMDAMCALGMSLHQRATRRNLRRPTRPGRLTVHRHGARFRGQGPDGILN